MDDYDANSPARFTALAVGFELALGVLAVLLGWLTGPWPWSTLTAFDAPRLLAGIAGGITTALLLFAGLVLVDRKPFGIFRQLNRTVRRHIAPLFRGTRVWELLAISLAAGLGEELLFRGYVQAALTDLLAHWLIPPWGAYGALLAASALFGICHWISSAYAIVATAMGLLLGGLMLATGDLLASILAHALYDFLALLYLTRRS